MSDTKITAKDTTKILEPLRLGVGKLVSGIQSGYVVFNHRTAYAFSGDIYAQITLPKEFGLDIGETEGCTPYKSLVDILKKYDGKVINLSVQGDRLVIACGRSRTKLAWDTNVCVPVGVVGEPKEDRWRSLPERFAESIKECEQIVDVRRECTLLSTIHVTSSYIESASTARVVRCKCETELEQEFLFNAGQLSLVFDYPLTEYQIVDTRWFFVRGENIMFGIPMHFEPYLSEMDGIFKRDGREFKLDGITAGDIRLAQAIMDKGNDLLVTIKNGKCVVKGKGFCGSHSVEVDIDDTGLDTGFYVSPIDLGRIVERSAVCKLGEKTLSIETDTLHYVATVDKVGK